MAGSPIPREDEDTEVIVPQGWQNAAAVALDAGCPDDDLPDIAPYLDDGGTATGSQDDLEELDPDEALRFLAESRSGSSGRIAQPPQPEPAPPPPGAADTAPSKVTGVSAAQLEKMDPLAALDCMWNELNDSDAHVAPTSSARLRLANQLPPRVKARAFSLILSGLGIADQREQAARLVASIRRMPLDQARKLLQRPVVTVLRRVSRKKAQAAYELFQQAGIPIRVAVCRKRRKRGE